MPCKGIDLLENVDIIWSNWNGASFSRWKHLTPKNNELHVIHGYMIGRIYEHFIQYLKKRLNWGRSLICKYEQSLFADKARLGSEAAKVWK